MKMPFWGRVTGVVYILLLAVGCGDGTNGFSDDPMYEEIEQVLDGMVDNWNAGNYATIEEAFQGAADFLEGQELVAEVNLRTGEGMPVLWADFKNGITFTLMSAYNAFDVDPEDLPHPAPPGILRDVGDSGLPGKQAVFLQLAGLPSVAWTASKMADENKYLPTYGTDAVGTVDFFTTLSSYQLVYISSHGAFLKLKGGDRFAIMTGEKRTKARDEAFKKNGDFASNKILLVMTASVLGVGPYSVPQLQKQASHYAVTDLYIDEHNGNFEPYSLVVLDTCDSAKPHSEPYPGNPLIKVLLAKNVGGVFGWDRSVSPAAALRAMKYLFSRLFGDDSQHYPRTPPIRPFGATDTYQGMESAGFHIDNIPHPSGPSYNPSGAVLRWAPQDFGSQSDQVDVLLRPAIHKVDVTNLVSDQEIRLLGDFGSKQGEVCVADSCASAKEWDINEVVADCGSGKYGLVTVKVEDHESNPVPLTQWEGVFKTEGDIDTEIGPHIKVDMNFKFRADIHKFRVDPEASPDPMFSEDAGPFEAGTECNFTLSGRNPPFEDENYTYNYTGQGVSTVSPDGSEYEGAAYIRPGEGKIEFQIVCGVHGTLTKTNKQTGIPDTQQYDTFVVGYFEVPIDEYGSMQAGEDELMPGLDNLPVEWDAVTPECPPDEETPS